MDMENEPLMDNADKQSQKSGKSNKPKPKPKVKKDKNGRPLPKD